jgi:hypothetical protein
VIVLALPAAYALSIRPVEKWQDVLFFFLSTRMLPVVGAIVPIYVIARDISDPFHLQVLRGVNEMFVWSSDPTGSWVMEEIAKTFEDGEIDAYVGNSSDFTALAANGVELRNITPEDVAQIDGNPLATLPNVLDSKREAIVCFLRAWAKGQYVGLVNREVVEQIAREKVPAEWRNEASGEAALDMARMSVGTTHLFRNRLLRTPAAGIATAYILCVSVGHLAVLTGALIASMPRVGDSFAVLAVFVQLLILAFFVALGTVTDPVAGSGSCPSWIAPVSKSTG